LVRSGFASEFGECRCDFCETDFIGTYFELETSRLFDVVKNPEGVSADVFKGDECDLAVLC
jgi:hypothetical protein